MRVVLAGYNVDARVLAEAERAGVPHSRLTPEIISAAYARISRDPRPVGDLRQIALEEVEQARQSNRTIIFEMGHHSIAEHAVFNFDVSGISRLAIEQLEHFRLSSFTEKSQRYITLDHDFTIPEELRGTPSEQELLALVTAQASLYDKLNRALRERLCAMHPSHEETKNGRRLLDGWAKEDARYATILATTGQLGLTVNARNLELMIRRFAASPLAEVRDLGRQLYKSATAHAPSLLLFTEASPYDRDTREKLASLAAELLPPRDPSPSPSEDVALVRFTPEADRLVAAALLHSVSARPFRACLDTVLGLDPEALRRVFATAFEHMEFFDTPPRALEHVSLTYEVTLSASAYAQLKRHRMATQTLQDYDPSLGLTVPPAVVEVGLRDDLERHAARAAALCETIREHARDAAAYVLVNAHRRRVLLSTNLRELYHIMRLRQDAHAQWDIRNVAASMRARAEEVMPLGALLLCGKDGYGKRYEQIFGRPPAILPPAG